MITISLDLSTKSTGFAVFKDSKLIDYGELKEKSKEPKERIIKITNQLEKLFKKYEECLKVIIEEVRPEMEQTSQKNLHTQKVLMWLQASLVLMLYQKNPKIEIEYTYPNEWRKQCGIHTGRSIKRDSLKLADIKFVKDTYGIETTDDAADAIGIGHAYLHNLSNEINW